MLRRRKRNSKRRMPQPMTGRYLSWSLSTILMLPAPRKARAACQMYHQSASTWWFAMMIDGRDVSVGSCPLSSNNSKA